MRKRYFSVGLKESKAFLKILIIILVLSSVVFFIMERVTHEEFFFHLAAIPLEILLAVFIVERLLIERENREKRKQLMYIKSHLFRSKLRNLFLMNFEALKSPSLAIAEIKGVSLEELKQMRQTAENVDYKSLEAMEPVIDEYVRVQHVWRELMDRAIAFHFEEIVEDMSYIFHFIHDVELFKRHYPDDKLFIHEAEKRPALMKKAKKVLGDGIRKFLDYAIELKEKQPEMFQELLEDYEISYAIMKESHPG